MLPKQFRLQDYQDIEKVKNKGRLYQAPFFGVLVFSRNDTQNSRFTFLISLKISKKATKRNRAKRLLSESVRLLLPKIKPGYDLVFLAKKNIIDKFKTEIGIEVERVFEKIELMIKDGK